MVDGNLWGFQFQVTLDYRSPADTALKVISTGLNTVEFDPVQFQIIDVTGTGSRRAVALSANSRGII